MPGERISRLRWLAELPCRPYWRYQRYQMDRAQDAMCDLIAEWYEQPEQPEPREGGRA